MYNSDVRAREKNMVATSRVGLCMLETQSIRRDGVVWTLWICTEVYRRSRSVSPSAVIYLKC